jgi:serine O-acetyltransferase
MENTFSMLKADLERLYLFEGRIQSKIGVPQIVMKAISPRFMPVVLYRLSHRYNESFPALAKFFSLVNYQIFGLEIASRCSIGPGLFFPHTMGTVIGAERIGARATIYHGVTLGAKEVDIGYSQNRRPIVGDDVLIGSGAKILGGIEIGHGVRIGANSLVIKNIPNGATVFTPLPVVSLKDENESE